MSYIDPAGKLLYHLDRLAAIQAGEHPAPVNVEVDLSNRCNLGCAGCHMAATHTRGPLASRRMVEVGDLIQAPLAFNLLGQLETAGVQSVTWSGGGEPTLHPEFCQIVNYAHFAKLKQGLYTNGTHLAPYANLIKRAMSWVVVSMDEAEEVAYARYKGPFFEQACAGVRALVRSEGSAVVGLSFLLDEHNWHQGPQMIELGDELGADYVNFRPLIRFDAVNPGRRAGDNTWLAPAIQWLKDAKNGTYGPLRIEADPERFEIYRNWHTPSGTRSAGHGYPLCYWAQLQAVITPDGRVWTCCNRRGREGDCLGDMNRESFSQIWERSKAKEVSSGCRVLCRGHLPNRTLHALFDQAPAHKEFI